MRKKVMRFLDDLWNWCLFKHYKVSIGKNFKYDCRLVLQGRGIFVRNNVRIISREFFNLVWGNRTVLQTFEGGKIQIGNNMGISHAILCARKSITIENNILIDGGVKIYDNDFHSIEFDNRMASPDTYIRGRKVCIKEKAFIGTLSIILKGVTVGQHSVVGAGSVVAKDIPDREIWDENSVIKIGIVDQ